MSLKVYDGLVEVSVILDVRGLEMSLYPELRKVVEVILGEKLGIESFSTLLLRSETVTSDSSRAGVRTLVRLRPRISP